jgi:hypothetical protein
VPRTRPKRTPCARRRKPGCDRRPSALYVPFPVDPCVPRVARASVLAAPTPGRPIPVRENRYADRRPVPALGVCGGSCRVHQLPR